jgi:hypothetical protein
MAGRPSNPGGLHALEAEFAQIEFVHEHIDHGTGFFSAT